MKKKITRRQVDAWLLPIRRALLEMRSGYADEIDGFAVTRLHNRDDYVRLDWCLAGFRGLANRLFPEADTASLLHIETQLAGNDLITIEDIDAAMAMLKSLKKPLMRMPAAVVRDAVITEQLCIELDAIREAA
jgi:hypothetical protein